MRDKHLFSHLHNDVVDGDVNELHKESDEPHHREADSSRQGDALELCGKREQHT